MSVKQVELNQEMKDKVDKLKEELGGNQTELVVNEESKVRKVVTWVLQGVALVATGLVGFFIGQHVGGDKDEDTNETQEEKPEEE